MSIVYKNVELLGCICYKITGATMGMDQWQSWLSATRNLFVTAYHIWCSLFTGANDLNAVFYGVFNC